MRDHEKERAMLFLWHYNLKYESPSLRFSRYLVCSDCERVLRMKRRRCELRILYDKFICFCVQVNQMVCADFV